MRRYSKDMTWTQIDPDRLSKYEGMSPSDIGREIYKAAIIERPQHFTREFMLSQERMHRENTEPYNWTVKNDDFMDFWKPVYDLKNVSMDEWTVDDWFAYRALNNVMDSAFSKSHVQKA